MADAMEQAKAEFDAAREDDTKRIAELETTIAERETEWAQQRESLLSDTSAALTARDAAETRAVQAEARADKVEAALAKAKAKVSRGDVPAAPRKLGPLAGVPLTDDQISDAIASAQADGKRIEVAFSDGKTEVAGLAPVLIEGEVWKTHPLGLMLRDPVTVKGPDAGGASITIAGYALLIDGKQVAWTPRSDPLAIAPGQEISLADDIWF